jgi:outer membrane protein OmpA-like peptidoglycan-associated protein
LLVPAGARAHSSASEGATGYNQRLSGLRAAAVKNYLIERGECPGDE